MRAVILEPCFERTTPWMMARVVGSAGTIALPSQIATVRLEVWDDDAPSDASPIHVVPTIVPADVFFATLQLEERWTRDEIGYNFGYKALKVQLPKGRRNYRFEFKCITDEAEPNEFYVTFMQPTLPLRSQ